MDEPIELLYPDWPAPPNVRACSTTRRGGVSTERYASLNLGTQVGDDPECVAANRRRVSEAGRIPAEITWLRQVHGTNVIDAGTSPPDVQADGAYTTRRQRACVVLSADCLPVLLCDRAGTEVAALHAGWRGLAAGVIEAGLKALRSPPSECLAWLGPAIGPQAYEIGHEVRHSFLEHDPRAASAFLPSGPGKWHMNIYALARQRLSALGVDSIYGGDYCTARQADFFYSHRRDGVTGRMATFIWLE